MANRRCEALKGDGSRCQARAMDGYQWCYSHRPDLADERKRNASRGGRTGGRGRSGGDEVAQAKKEIRGVLGGILKGKIPRGTGSVLFMGFNVLLRAIEVERKIREQDELEDRIAELERIAGPDKGGRTWGA